MSRVAEGSWHPPRSEPHPGGRGFYPPQDQWDDHEEYPGYRGAVHSPLNGYSSEGGSSTPQMADGPTYLLEHLATFTVSEDADLVYPSDGMRRLLHMEKTTGIWTQKMQLKLLPHWVLILSHENEDVVERYPMELIREPTAFSSDDPKELYNNIFIFVVAEDDRGKYKRHTDMHIFQCLLISAKDVVEDMKMCMAGKFHALRGAGDGGVMRRGREHIPPPPMEKAPQPPLSNGYRGAVYLESPMRGRRSDRSSIEGGPSGAGADDVSSVSSESYSKDVAILNSCFDDIEKFIARLQHIASATRELERRRSGDKHKKKNMGDGMLSMRAKAPPEIDFIEIFQKFKLSFNMLGKLRTYIHEPNAPELVHFLFTPLAIILDTSKDSNYGNNLPAKVVSPLLTREAINLLQNCLHSGETELWQSLGDAWLIPKDTWKYPVPPYQPVFSSGWAPELPEETRPDHYSKHRGHREDLDEFYPPGQRGGSPHHGRFSRNPYSESEVSGSESVSGPEGGVSSGAWINDLRSRGAKMVTVTYPRTANNDKELTVVRGEVLEVMDDSRKWWKCANSRGQAAHVPHTIVTPYAPEPEHPSSSDWLRGKDKHAKKGDMRYMYSP